MDQLLPNGTTVTLVHFSYLMEQGERIACAPNMAEMHTTPYHPAYQRTNDVRAVSCPMCKKTDLFRKNVEILQNALKGPIGIKR